MDFCKDWHERKFKPTLDEDIKILMDGYDELFNNKVIIYQEVRKDDYFFVPAAPDELSITCVNDPNTWDLS